MRNGRGSFFAICEDTASTLAVITVFANFVGSAASESRLPLLGQVFLAASLAFLATNEFKEKGIGPWNRNASRRHGVARRNHAAKRGNAGIQAATGFPAMGVLARAS